MKLDEAVVFGDVHGEYEQLLDFVQRVRAQYGPVQLFSLGDLIDRGPDSKKVVQLCVDEDIRPVLGNHDLWFGKVCAGKGFDDFALRKIMGGKSTLLSYGLSEEDLHGRTPGHIVRKVDQTLPDLIPYSHKDLFLKAPLFRRVEVGVGEDAEVYWLVHTSIKKAKMQELLQAFRDEEAALHDYPWHYELWVPTRHWRPDEIYAFENGCQIFGHTVTEEPVLKGHFIALDTGCGTAPPFKLSGVHLPSMQLI